MKKLLMFPLILAAVALCGCSKEPEPVSMETTILNIPLTGDRYMELPIPLDDALVSTDGYVVWNFASGGNITKYTKAYDAPIISHKGEVIYSDEEADVAVSISGNDEWVQYLETHSTDVTVRFGVLTLDPRNQLEEIQMDRQLEYVDTEVGIKMPKGYEYNSWLMPTYKEGLSYFTTGVKYWNEEEIKEFALSYLKANNYGETMWFSTGDHFLAYNEKVGVGYKKLTVNKYIVYMSSLDNFDYIVLNMEQVIFQWISGLRI